jgi:hypothetical protein
VELLSLKLKANQDIHSIIINEVESLISLYADDTFLIIDESENSLREALECLESFYKVSGLKSSNHLQTDGPKLKLERAFFF